MKIRKVQDKRILARVYYKHVVTIPKEIALKFINKQLKCYTENNKIIIEPL